MTESTTPAWQALGLLVAPVVAGALVMRLGGAPSGMWAAHLATGAVGMLLYAATTRAPRLSLGAASFLAVTGAFALAVTLAAPGLQGVHRWLELPGLRLNASQLVMPALLVFAATNLRGAPTLAQVQLLVVQGIHLLQPDAGQATAVAVAALVLLRSGPRTRASRASAAVLLAAAVATWMRADPLQPVPFVEDITSRALALHWTLGCLGLAAIAGAALAPIVSVPQGATSDATLAGRVVTTYFATAAVVVAFGAFPVPLLGFGASSIVGASLALAAVRRAVLHGLPREGAGLAGLARGSD